MSKLYENGGLRAVCGDALRPGGLDITREALDLCAFAPGAVLIDLGCGPGGTLKYLRDNGFEAMGVDLSPAMLAEAAAFGPVAKADFQSLPFVENFADGILCECALSLAADKSAVLSECFRVLKSGGRLIVSDIFRMKGDEAQTSPVPPDSCQAGAISPDGLRLMLRESGFEVEHYADHSRALKELAARLVWHFGSAAALRELAGGGGDCGGKDFGYALFIARAMK